MGQVTHFIIGQSCLKKRSLNLIESIHITQIIRKNFNFCLNNFILKIIKKKNIQFTLVLLTFYVVTVTFTDTLEAHTSKTVRQEKFDSVKIGFSKNHHSTRSF